jgi:hypothetical protein
MNRGVVDGIKESYYEFGIVLDWSKLRAILDVQSKKKGKYEYSVLWNDSTLGENTWISEAHFPDRIRSYLEQFQLRHSEEYGNNKKNKGKLTTV